MMDTEKFDEQLARQIELQIVLNKLRMIEGLVEILMNPSDYGLTETGKRNLEFRIIQMHNQLPL